MTRVTRRIEPYLVLGPLLAATGLPLPSPLSSTSQENPPSVIHLQEVSREWGIDFRHHHGGSGERFMVESVVGGVVILDFDLDGDDDLFFVDGGPLPGYQGEQPRSQLYRNEGAGRFIDFTAQSGIVVDSYGCGGSAGDVDGDGDLDLYVTALGSNQLFENRGNGSFLDVTAKAGVGDPLWSTSTAFADTDLDGDLDLYVANYVDFTIATHKFCGDEKRDLQGYCHPSAYAGMPDRFYRNRGDGTYIDATREAGFGNATEAGLGVAFADVDGDGWPDLYVANDADPNFLFRNRGDGTFEDVSLLSGTAYSELGKPEGSMGVEFGDIDEDGDLDLLVSNFEFETNALYQNVGSAIFIDSRFPSGIAEPTKLDLTFGVIAGDLDHDGDLDVVYANGHILDNAEKFDRASRSLQANRVFENLGEGKFRLVSDHGLDSVRMSRALAQGDLDRDGDLDLVIVNTDDTAEVYENDGVPNSRNWLQVDLRQTGREVFGIGARLELQTARGLQVREVHTGSSFLSQSALTAHFGLAGASQVNLLTVLWPGQGSSQYRALPANRRLVLFKSR